jgi:hypothetical protein
MTGSSSASHRSKPSSSSSSSNGSTKLSGSSAVQKAKAYLRELTGREAESVSALARGGRGGWQLVLEAVELERVPTSTDVLGSYEVELDERGELLRCERVGRYYRNQAGGDAS